jgi:hypothetical protein
MKLHPVSARRNPLFPRSGVRPAKKPALNLHFERRFPKRHATDAGARASRLMHNIFNSLKKLLTKSGNGRIYDRVNRISDWFCVSKLKHRSKTMPD